MTKNIRELADRFYEIVNGDDGEFSEIFSSNFVFGIMFYSMPNLLNQNFHPSFAYKSKNKKKSDEYQNFPYNK